MRYVELKQLVDGRWNALVRLPNGVTLDYVRATSLEAVEAANAALTQLARSDTSPA